MKKIIFFIAFLNCLITLGQSEFSSKSNSSNLSDVTLSQIRQRLKDFEIVDFDHKSLDKFLKASNKQAKIKLGKNISGTWDFEENELRASYVGKSKYDSDGNLLNGVELAETYMAKSEKNPNANIRLLVSSSLIAGFIHDGDAFIRIESLAYFLNSQKAEYDGKIIIYDDRNAIITNEIKCGVNAKQSTVSSLPRQNRIAAPDYCKRLLSIAVETDADFTGNIQSVMQEVDYILYLNFGLKVEYYHKSWSGQSVNPYSSTYVPFIPAGAHGAGRIEEGVIFGRFQNAGWVVNNLPGYDMYHLITGRNIYASGNGNSGGQALMTPICGSQKPLSISSTEFSGVTQIARTMCHELGHNLSGNPNHDTGCISCQNTTPSNTIMCTFISGVGGCRGLYFSSTSRTQIENNLQNNNTCLSPTPAPIINQVYFNGTPVGTNLNLVSTRAGQMSVNVSDTYPFPSTIVNWIPTVSTVNVYGNPGKTISYFVPNNVSIV